MLMQRQMKSVTIVEMALSVWAIIHLADAFDHCDVRHKFTNDKGKCFSTIFAMICVLFIPQIHNNVLKYYNIS